MLVVNAFLHFFLIPKYLNFTLILEGYFPWVEDLGFSLGKSKTYLHSVLTHCVLRSQLNVYPDGSDGKEAACNAGDPGSIPGLGRCPGEGNGYPFQYSCLENPMDRGAW